MSFHLDIQLKSASQEPFSQSCQTRVPRLRDASCLHYLLFTGSDVFQSQTKRERVISSAAICSNWYWTNIFLSNTRVFDVYSTSWMWSRCLTMNQSSWLIQTSLIRDLHCPWNFVFINLKWPIILYEILPKRSIIKRVSKHGMLRSKTDKLVHPGIDTGGQINDGVYPKHPHHSLSVPGLSPVCLPLQLQMHQAKNIPQAGIRHWKNYVSSYRKRTDWEVVLLGLISCGLDSESRQDRKRSPCKCLRVFGQKKHCNGEATYLFNRCDIKK